MAQTFVKLLKWLISVSFFIFGIWSLRMTFEGNTIRPLILAIFGLGIVYWMSKATYEASKKIFLIGLGLVLAAGVAARLFVWSLLLDKGYDVGYYLTWEICSFSIGIPVMAYVFWKED